MLLLLKYGHPVDGTLIGVLCHQVYVVYLRVLFFAACVYLCVCSCENLLSL